jgi:uncharacterized glyoxalase superfamily protein PhnB
MQTIFPILRYDDARGAICSLCAAFGFVELFSVPETGQFVRHAQLRLGTNVIMLGSVRPDERMATPETLGAATQALSVYVDDVEGHFERARSAGAEITGPPQDTDFGSREYHVVDLEGHPWTFGTYRPDVDGFGGGS